MPGQLVESGRTSPEGMCVLANASAPGQITVLLVDDEPLVRNFLRQLLEEERKYRVLTAASGEEALAVSRQSAGSIDLLITDFAMGKLNGVQLYTQLSKDRPGTAVLFVSANADLFQEFYVGLPFLKKPFARKDFVTKLQEVHNTQLQGRSPMQRIRSRLEHFPPEVRRYT